MADLKDAIIVVAIISFIALILLLKFRSEMAQRQMLFEAQRHLLDKLGSGAEVTQFLGSQEGKEFFDRLKPAPKPDNPPPSPAEVVFVMIWAGTIVSLIGVGFFIGAAFVDPRLIVPGALCLTAGVGVLIGLFITHQLAKKWGYFKPYRPPTSQNS
ncbi:MAG TPA: hypothetical protein VFR18_20605 [Terriglobia bacterium]|nr:hypothetical protein [Terriglobia bacterium]